MGEAKRRRDLAAMAKSFENSVSDVLEIDRRQLGPLIRAAEAGDQIAFNIVNGIRGYLVNARDARSGEGPQCGTCESEFCGEDKPEFFYAMVPEERRGPYLALIGICRACANLADSVGTERLTAFQQRIWPGSKMVSVAHFLKERGSA
jgi:hypothetical protein